MGFLQVVNGTEMDAEKLARFWGNISPTRIENGGRVIIRGNEFLIQLSGDRIADIITEAGGYIYHSDIEANPDKEAYDEVFAEFAEKHSGFFGNKEIAILSDSRKMTSAEQFGRFLNELAGENLQSPAPPVQPPPVILSKPEKTWICGKCGTENEFSYCKKCGASRTSNSEIYAEPKPSYIPVSESETVEPTTTVPSESEETWVCGKCGTENELNFCRSCGASRTSNSETYTEPKQTYIPVSEPETVAPPTTVPSKSEETWVCGKCGTENELNYCRSCGASRTSNSEIYAEPKPLYIPVSEPETVAPPTAVQSKSEEIWICGECGTKNKFSYCKNCGASRKIDSEIYTAPKTYIPLSEAKIVEPPPIIPSKSGEIWVCGECGTKNKFSYCKSCGASRKPDSEIYTETEPTHTSFLKMADDMWVCGKCGTKNKFSFCKKCGSSRPKNY